MTEERLRLLFYNTYLLRVRLPWPGGGRELASSAPAVTARSREIGPAVAGGYDVVAMSEVWHEPEQRAVLAGWGSTPVAHAVGPTKPSVPSLRTSSGLLTVVDGPRLVRHETHTFRQRGSYWRDAEAALANKGVLLTEVDAGAAANLEVFSTHLISGNDFLKRPGGQYGAVADIRQKQAEELIAFVQRVHRPENVALVVGDFNVPAVAPDENTDRYYRNLRRSFEPAGFDDLWTVHGNGPGYTFVDSGDLDAVCRLGGDGCCAEPADDLPPGVEAARIDHAWLQRPDPLHRLAVDVASLRRRSFPRTAGTDGYDRIRFLSDHLALHIELNLRST